MAGEFGTIGSRRRSRWPSVFIGFVFLVLVAGLGYVLGARFGVSSTPSTTVPVADTERTNESASVEASVPIASDAITWYSASQAVSPTPTLFGDLGSFYAEGPGGTEATIDYTVSAVGEVGGKRILVASLSPWSLDFRSHVPVLFRQDSATTYALLLKHSPDVADYQDKSVYTGPTLAPGVSLDISTIFSSIAHQPTVTVKGVELKAGSDYPQLWADIEAKDNATLTSYAEIPAGTLYRNRAEALALPAASAPNSVALDRFVLKRPNNLAQVYQFYPPILADDYTMRIDWDDGKTTTDTYRPDGLSGCGSPDSLAVWDGDVSTLEAVGKAKDGKTIYAFAKTTDPVVAYYYDASGGATFDADGKETKFSVDDYVKNRAVVAYQDPLGRVILFMNTYYGPAAECGKPVVYLYPPSPMDVSVQVGAAVTVSEPEYGNGWNVLAEPSGKLTLADGHQYDSLFWEGLGNGTYPPITAGFVVEKHELEATLRDHLSRLGLNAKESADFLEFWLPRMPDEPYTRLTWFGTRQMDELAPLTVSPKPDTSIRIFLDFEGLTDKLDLPTQRLVAPERKGFTLVEWGGLLKR